ncbi:MAG: translation initiation factor IF-3 [Ignavibacteriae bacterium]|nr:translation initiation factor IF-3 [Ignavibacteriota bacterium]
MKDKKYKERVNQEITAYQVRVVDEDGQPLGVMPSHEALRFAQSRSLDLVEIAPNSKPPVCKVIDYGKYNYERQKKDKLQKKNQSVMTVKEIRFNANTDDHDIDFKTKHLRQFLFDGHKVKTSVLYKGRMITHPEIGQKLMEEVLAKVLDIGKLESKPKLEGKMLTTYVVPDKNKIAVYNSKIAKMNKVKVKTETVETTEPVNAETEDIKAENVNTDAVIDTPKEEDINS